MFERLARGEELAVPNLGMETFHHVHADDVALAFEQALANWNAAVDLSAVWVAVRESGVAGAASTLLGVYMLALEGQLVEIEAIAVLE